MPINNMIQLFLVSLEKLHTVGKISKVSSDSSESQMNSVIYDIMQAQLALWTLVFSVLYSYAWQQHRKKFLLSLFFVVPTVFTVSCGIAALLTAVVILGRIFCSPVYFNDLFKLGKSMDPCVEQTMYPRLRRSSSGASSRSTLSIHSVRSTDELPIPLCRRHSNGSLNGFTPVEPIRPPSQPRKMSYCYSHFSADG